MTLVSKNISFTAFLINGPGKNFEFWNSYLRFEYHINDLIKSPDYQPVIIGALLAVISRSSTISLRISGYQSESDTSHKSSVSFTDKVTNFINSK